MKPVWIILGVLGTILLLGIFFTIGTYNTLVNLDEKVNESWAQVQNVYQRRVDLIPNLVATVKGIADQEKTVFIQVAEARSKAGQIQLTPAMLSDPNALQFFQKAQAGLSSALTKLLAVAENYPQLKSNENFLALQGQLEGTENRITVERMRFNEVARQFNTKLRIFPGSIIARMMGFSAKAYFEADQGAEKAPQVVF